MKDSWYVKKCVKISKARKDTLLVAPEVTYENDEGVNFSTLFLNGLFQEEGNHQQ